MLHARLGQVLGIQCVCHHLVSVYCVRNKSISVQFLCVMSWYMYIHMYMYNFPKILWYIFVNYVSKFPLNLSACTQYVQCT